MQIKKDRVQNFLLYVLFLTMILLALSYFLEIRAVQTERQNVSFEKMWFLSGDENPVPPVKASDWLILPSFMGCRRADGEMIGVSGDTAFIGALYKTYADYLAEWLGSGYTCTALDDAEGKAVWSEALGSDCFLYFRYPYDLPSPLVYQFLSENTLSNPGEIAKGDVISFCEIISVIDERGVTRVFARGDGGVAAFSPSSAGSVSYFDRSLLSSFSGSASLYSFFFSDSEQYPFLKEGTVLSERIPMHSALVPDPASSMFFSENESDAGSLLDLFSDTPSMVSRYTEQDGKTVWVSSDFRMEWTVDGNLICVASEASGGMPFEKIFGTLPGNGAFSLNESVRLLSSLALRFADLCGGGSSAGDLRISGIRLDSEGNTALFFDYFFEGVSLSLFRDGVPVHAFSCTFRDGRLLSLSFEMLSLSRQDAGKSKVLFSSAWVADHLTGTSSPVSLSLIYRLTDKSSPEPVFAAWYCESLLGPGGEDE